MKFTTQIRKLVLVSCEFNSHWSQLYFLKTLRCQFCTKMSEMSDLCYLRKPLMFSAKFHNLFIFIYIKFVLLSHNVRGEPSIRRKRLPEMTKQLKHDGIIYCSFFNLSAFTLFFWQNLSDRVTSVLYYFPLEVRKFMASLNMVGMYVISLN